MGSHRFFCPNLPEVGSVTLTETEAHHLVHVLRHQPDDIVDLFNGQGLVASCRITAIRKRDVALEMIAAARHDPPPRIALTLATAVPKGDRFDWLIEKATELGVHQLVPIITSRSIVDPRDSKLDKLRQTVVTACKQSGRNSLMKISAVTHWPDFLRQHVPDTRTLIAHPSGRSLGEISGSLECETRPLTIAIGPEGGFSDEEVESAVTAGAEAIQLGQNILRIETAAIALASKLLL